MTCWGSGGHPGTRPSFFDDFGRLGGGTLVSMDDPWETRCGLLSPIGAPQAPFLMVFLRSSRGVSFFIGFWWPGLRKRGRFRGVRCGLYIVNNMSGAHVAILRRKLLSEAPRPPFYLHFLSILEPWSHVWCTLAHFCLPWCSFCTPFCTCLCTGAFFMDFGVPAAPQIFCRRLAQPSGG